MNVSHTAFAAFIVAFAGAASAQEATPDHWISTGASSSLSRADVSAELAQARRSGEHARIDAEVPVLVADGSRSRVDVRDELARSRSSGEYARINAEVPSFDTTPRQPMFAARSGS